jgi:hypothetical protein
MGNHGDEGAGKAGANDDNLKVLPVHIRKGPRAATTPARAGLERALRLLRLSQTVAPAGRRSATTLPQPSWV